MPSQILFILFGIIAYVGAACTDNFSCSSCVPNGCYWDLDNSICSSIYGTNSAKFLSSCPGVCTTYSDCTSCINGLNNYTIPNCGFCYWCGGCYGDTIGTVVTCDTRICNNYNYNYQPPSNVPAIIAGVVVPCVVIGIIVTLIIYCTNVRKAKQVPKTTSTVVIPNTTLYAQPVPFNQPPPYSQSQPFNQPPPYTMIVTAPPVQNQEKISN